MHFEILDESHHGRLVIKTAGPYTVDDNIEMIRQIVAHEKWHHGMSILVDHRNTSFAQATVADIFHLTEVTAIAEKHHGYGRCAIVAPDVDYSKAAMYEFQANTDLRAVTRVFPPQDYQEAIRWLESGE